MADPDQTTVTPASPTSAPEMSAVASSTPAGLTPDAATSEPEIPLAGFWPPEPTFRDRMKFKATFALALVAGVGVSYFSLDILAPIVLPQPGGIALRASAGTGTAIGASLLGIVIASVSRRWHVRRRFSNHRDRLIFTQLLSQGTTRDEAELFADSHNAYDTVTRIGGRAVVFLLGLYCWSAWSMMHISIDGSIVAWRSFSLIRHQRQASDVAAIYLTRKDGGFGRADRRCVVVQFVDKTEVRSDELSPSDAECDRFALALADASGKPITPVPWLQRVPAPK